MTNVALYGGSFDPPHIGHVMVASHLLLNDPSVEEVVIAPCFQHLEKTGLAPFHTRYAMCKEAFGWLPRTRVSNIEEELGGGSLTVRTVRALKAKHPDWRVFFVMGSDLMAHAPEWEGWDELILEATPLIVGRAGLPSNAGFKTPVHTPISPAVSSTQVREALEKEAYHDAERYLPRRVLDIIENYRLYSKVSSSSSPIK